MLLLLVILFMPALFGCSQAPSDLKDGYYTAEAKSFDDLGWKEYVLIYVSNGKIITVEYDAFNSTGFVKSWDLNYMRKMNEAIGTYPNEFSRIYMQSLISRQSAKDVDAVSGATHSHDSFQKLAEAAIESSKAGSKNVAIVDLSKTE